MNIYSIYKITNKINGKIYIGFSKNPRRRWQNHLRESASGSNFHLHNALRKYNKNNFKLEVIYQGKEENYILNIMEPYFIEEYNTFLGEGYNMTPGGEKPPDPTGKPRSFKTRKKISVTRIKKGIKPTHNCIEASIRSNIGRPAWFGDLFPKEIHKKSWKTRKLFNKYIKEKKFKELWNLNLTKIQRKNLSIRFRKIGINYSKF